MRTYMLLILIMFGKSVG